MTLQIELSSELEALLREQAAAAHMNFAAFVLRVLEETAELGSEYYEKPEELTKEQWLAAWHVFVASARPLGHIVDDSRESIYEGRGE